MTPHVVIAGGGIGALEGLLALQDLAGDRVGISVPSPPRDTSRTGRCRWPSRSEASPRGATTGSRSPAIAACAGSRIVLEAVRPGSRQFKTRDGPPVSYDGLLLALGARAEPALAGAVTFAGPSDVLAASLSTIEALPPGGLDMDRLRRHDRHGMGLSRSTGWC